VFIAYQMMFAIITPALITGAFANRVTFQAYMIFLTLWLLFVYFPFEHMVWGGGMLQDWGVLDFAGGIVVHNIAGISEFGVDVVTAVAFLNTDLAASFAAIAWLALGWSLQKKPTFVGLLTGAVAGLATITPAAGYVSPTSAVIIGLAAGVVCYFAVALKNKLRWDDALDVWGVHGVGGFLGIILLGVLATTGFNPNGTDGLLNGDATFFFKQCAAVALSTVWAFAFAYGMLWLIDRVTTVRVTHEHEQLGLDAALHGERAYLEVA
jgi:Amt family ammonium transporter